MSPAANQPPGITGGRCRGTIAELAAALASVISLRSTIHFTHPSKPFSATPDCSGKRGLGREFPRMTIKDIKSVFATDKVAGFPPPPFLPPEALQCKASRPGDLILSTPPSPSPSRLLRFPSSKSQAIYSLAFSKQQKKKQKEGIGSWLGGVYVCMAIASD